MHRTRFKAWAIAGTCLLMVAVGAIGARAAIEGAKIKAAPPWLGLFGVAIRPDNSIYIVGSKALLMVSTDAGKSWTQRLIKERPGGDLFQDRDLYSIRFGPGGKSGWIVGEDGLVLRTDDGGDTWTVQESGTVKNLFKVAVLDDQNALVVGADGIILRTDDGGKSWKTITSPKNVTIFDVTFVDKNVGWAVGEFSTILTTADGGQTWTLNYGGNTTDFTIGPFFSVNFSDPTHGIVAGLAGDIMVTADAGKSWQAKKLPDVVGSYVMAEDPAAKKLWIGGSGGKLFDEGPDGQWQAVDRSTFHDLNDMAFAGDLGVAVGLNGTILLTNNAGEQWQAVQ
ncbi:MAG: hypothetical protein IVW56_02210 [Candidatus Binataceae bacterium]|nr:hypothetical protein [Candidatus Binataceae bacterium]